MQMSNLFANGMKLLKSNAPEILTALGVSGVVTTAYLTHKAATKAAEVLDPHDRSLPSDATTTEKVKAVWKFYIPPVASGVATMGCIIMASKYNNRRTAAAVAAYSLTQKAFEEYREKVTEQVGKNKEQRIRDEVVQDQIAKDPPRSSEIIMWGFGEVICCELLTHRYFRSDMESLRRAENMINAKINRELYVTLDELYDILDLPNTSQSDKMGWDSNKLVEFKFTSVLSQDGEPCLAFDYNYIIPLR
jgi:Family of unknown function (DUF6353)